MEIYRGRSVCPGIAIGPVFVLHKPSPQPDPGALPAPAQEWDAYEAASEQADLQLDALYQRARTELGEDEAMIVDVQRLMLHDEDFTQMIADGIHERGISALRAVQRAGNYFAGIFYDMEDSYLRARAADVLDVAHRLATNLTGKYTLPGIPHPSIVLADELTPSDTLQLDRKKVLAFATRKGSINNHAAILARMLNIPTVMQVDFPVLEAPGKMSAALDGATGILYLQPDPDTLQTLRNTRARQNRARRQLNTMRGLPTVTRDGRAIGLFANIGKPEGMAAALENDAEGIGLFRSEFLFIGRQDYPSEEEQYLAYASVAEEMGGKQVIIRTVDIGADKRAPYLGLPAEENPALGYRGVRLSMDRPDMFRTQLRAILRAAARGNVALLLPMVTSAWEVRTCRKMIAQALRSLQKDGLEAKDVQVGVMVETPAAVMTADALAKECDFFSVGTNDLTQYTLAIDRKNTRLEAFFDPRHPALLAMLEMVARCAARAHIPVSICGELAADPKLTQSFIQMGYSMLSVAPGHILSMRNRIRKLDFSEGKQK